MAEKVVACSYCTQNEGISAIRRLHEIGYDKKDISLLAKVPERIDWNRSPTDADAQALNSAAGDAGAGALTGGILGGLGALLVGLGVFIIPGVGPFLAAGPVATALGGIIAGTAFGGIVGTLVGLGLDKGDAEYYETELETGDLLVLATAGDGRNGRENDILRYPEEEYYSRYERSARNPMDVNPEGRAIEPIPSDDDR